MANRFLSPYERGLLSLAIKDLTILTELRQKITAEYFLYEPHKVIYTCICLLADDPAIKTVDLDTLYIECESAGIKNYGVSLDYLVLLSQLGSDKSNFEFYLAKVTNAYKKYALYLQLQDAISLVEKNSTDEKEEADADSLVNKVNADLLNLSISKNKEEEVIDFSEIVDKYVAERRENKGEILGLSTGIKSLDVKINGLVSGTVTVIAGKAKEGKSTLMLNIADYVAIESKNPVPVLIASTEMWTKEDLARLISMRSQVPERHIITGQIFSNEEELQLVEAAVYQIKRAKIYHKYMPSFNADEISNLIGYCKFKYGIGLAIFDYIKMETTASTSTIASRREDQILGEITNALKMSAGKLGIPVLAACQINNRTDIVADSDRIVRYCNTLIEFRSKSKDELEQQVPIHEYGTHWLNITHTRGGGGGRIPVTFYKPCLKILEAQKYIEEGTSTPEHNIQGLTTPRAVEKTKSNKFEDLSKDLKQTDSMVKTLLDTTDPNDDDEMF
jgi:replicative DNA helicase